MKGRHIPEVDTRLGFGNGGLSDLEHRSPRIVRDVLKRGESLSGHSPAETVGHAAINFSCWNTAAACDPDIVVPGKKYHLTIASHAILG